MDSYAGDYRMAPGQVYTISRKGDQLIFSVPGMNFPLVPLSKTEFLLAFADARITFQKDKEGKVQQFVWKQGGGEQIAPKIVLVRPTPQELQEFAGAYFNAELNLRYAVELRGDTLIVNAPGQNRVTGFIIDSDPVRDLVFKKN